MATTNEFENILSDCFDRLIKGETIKSCLKSYPHYAAELEPLLTTAQETLTATAIEPRPEFRQRAASEFQAAIRNMPVKQQHGWTFKWQLRWALPVVILLVLVGTGSGTVVAATNALPDSPLYSLKMATESVQMTFTFSNEAKAELYGRFVDYRVEEIVKMIEKGDLNLVTLTTDRMNGNMKAIAALGISGNRALLANDTRIMAGVEQTTSPGEGSLVPNDIPKNGIPGVPGANEESTQELSSTDWLIQHLLLNMERNLQILRDQLETAPAEFQAAIQHAIDVIEEGYWQVINGLT